MKIVIAEGGPAGNVGSMALIENAIKIVSKKHPSCEIVVMCAAPAPVMEALSKDGMANNVTVKGELFDKPGKNKIVQVLWLVRTVLWFLYSRIVLLITKNISWAFIGRSKSLLKEVEESEYVYCIGAERINDIYYKTALLALYCIGTYIKMGKKVVHMSLTIGPVFNKSTIYVAKKIMNSSYAIFVRDTKSFEILKEWNCKCPCQFSSYDIALFQHTKLDIADALMQEFSLEEGFIGVSVINWGFRHVTGPSRQLEYDKAHAEALDYIIEKYGKQIVFTPTVISKGYTVWDTQAADAVISLMKHKDRVISIQKLLTPCELATIYSRCYFSIVTRMHASILCSGAAGKPIIAVNYLYKLREYMKNIGFEDYSVDIDYVNTDVLKLYIDKMFCSYDTNIKKLNARITEMQRTLQNDLKEI